MPAKQVRNYLRWLRACGIVWALMVFTGAPWSVLDWSCDTRFLAVIAVLIAWVAMVITEYLRDPYDAP